MLCWHVNCSLGYLVFFNICIIPAHPSKQQCDYNSSHEPRKSEQEQIQEYLCMWVHVASLFCVVCLVPWHSKVLKCPLVWQSQAEELSRGHFCLVPCTDGQFLSTSSSLANMNANYKRNLFTSASVTVKCSRSYTGVAGVEGAREKKRERVEEDAGRQTNI